MSDTLKQIFEKHSLYIDPEIAKRIRESFGEWLRQRGKENEIWTITELLGVLEK